MQRTKLRMENYLDDLMAIGTIADYQVVCSESTVDIKLKPIESVIFPKLKHQTLKS